MKIHQDNSIHSAYSGLANSHSAVLPTQCLPESKKSRKWLHNTMDALEREAERQWIENRKFEDYYDSIAGRTTHMVTDFNEMPEFLGDIQSLREQAGIPTYIKNYDWIGVVVNVLQGIYNDFKDVFRVDSTDEYATNEFIREKTLKLEQYATETFQLELQKLLIMKGLDPNRQDFSSPEEQQAYLQQLDQQRQYLTPAEIEKDMAKNFKVLATEWAEKTLEEDQKRFGLDELDREEFIDYFITGRYFRHFRVGFDTYKPERWNPREVFFSKDINAKYPQNSEYVGRLTFISPSDIINTYGHLLTAKQQEAISNYWNQNEDYGNDFEDSGVVLEGETFFGEQQIVPFEDYYKHDLLLQYQSALDTPLGVRTIVNNEGKEETFRDYLPEVDRGSLSLSNRHAKSLRKDFDSRDDLVQVTEGYWRSYKRIGLLNFNDDNGVFRSVVVTDDLLSSFLAENEIKRLKTVTLEEFENAKRFNRLHEYVNTIIYTYSPEIRRFVKIKNNSQNLKKDIYLYGEPLEFQIKGDSNMYDFLIPVGGIITDSLALKLAPYQTMYNICMNQVYNLLEKEIGIFFLMDINYLPSEFTEGKDSAGAMWELRELAKDIGFVPVDMSRQNLQGQQPFNSFVRQDISFGGQVEYRITLADKYKREGLEQIGITPQLMGQPNKYVTSEGVQQGAQASFAQLLPIFEKIGAAKLKTMDLHLAIAQWCQANNKDNSVFYRRSDGAHYFLDIMKEDGEIFPLRKLGVVAVSSAKDRKALESIRQVFAQNNTITNDVLDIAEIFTSDTLTELIDTARQSRIRIEAQTQQERQFQEQQLDKQMVSMQEQQDKEIAFEAQEAQLDRQSKENIAQINNLGQLYDTNTDSENIQAYKVETSNLLTQQRNVNDALLKNKDLNIKEENNKMNWADKVKKFELEMEKLKVKKQQLATERYVATINPS